MGIYMFKTLLFIPMYNCERQITRVLAQIDQMVLRFITEIIVVNNCSLDNGEKKVKEFVCKNSRLPIKLLRNNKNYSVGGSHKIAFNYAIENGFDYVIVLHGDDQGDIHDILPYLINGEAYKYDSFLGSRFEKESKLINYSRFKTLGNHVFNFLLSLTLRRNITDLGSGLNMYKVDYLKSKFYMCFTNFLTFNVYMLLYGIYSDSKFRYFPLTWREDDQISNVKLFSQSIETLKLIFAYRVNSSKMLCVKNNTYSNIEYSYEEVCMNVQNKI